jgi:hypothetical protein
MCPTQLDHKDARTHSAILKHHTQDTHPTVLPQTPNSAPAITTPRDHRTHSQSGPDADERIPSPAHHHGTRQTRNHQ